MTAQTITTQTGRTLRIAATTTGMNFAYVGQVKAGNGRVIWQSEPRGTQQSAFDSAARWATKQA